MTNKPEPAAPDADRAMVGSEVIKLFGSDAIVKAIKNYKADTKEKELCLEFVQSYIQFLQELASIDSARHRDRSDPEVRDLVSHVNMLLKKRDEDVFTSMIVHSGRHYRQLRAAPAAGDPA